MSEAILKFQENKAYFRVLYDTFKGFADNSELTPESRGLVDNAIDAGFLALDYSSLECSRAPTVQDECDEISTMLHQLQVFKEMFLGGHV